MITVTFRFMDDPRNTRRTVDVDCEYKMQARSIVHNSFSKEVWIYGCERVSKGKGK